VDQFPEGAFVSAKTIGCIEAAKAGAAQPAAAFRIQREAVLKRCPATGAEELRIQGLRFVQANMADGNAADLLQRLAANPAIVRE
jgi:hypothetical protein